MLFRRVWIVDESSHQSFDVKWVVHPYLAQICREYMWGRKLSSSPLAASILDNVPGLWRGMKETPHLPSGKQEGKALLTLMVNWQGKEFHQPPSGWYPPSIVSFVTWIHGSCTVERWVRSEGQWKVDLHPVKPMLGYTGMSVSCPADDSSTESFILEMNIEALVDIWKKTPKTRSGHTNLWSYLRYIWVELLMDTTLSPTNETKTVPQNILGME